MRILYRKGINLDMLHLPVTLVVYDKFTYIQCFAGGTLFCGYRPGGTLCVRGIIVLLTVSHVTEVPIMSVLVTSSFAYGIWCVYIVHLSCTYNRHLTVNNKNKLVLTMYVQSDSGASIIHDLIPTHIRYLHTVLRQLLGLRNTRKTV